MNCSLIIKDMRWSFSRINSFRDCRYGWFLKYIKEVQSSPGFFAEYGSLVHKILEMYLSGQIQKDELTNYYISNFFSTVRGSPPSTDIYFNYYKKGIDYFDNIEFPYMDKISTELKCDFSLDGYNFIGIIDAVADDGKIIIDHKSRDLKPRSKRKTPTKTDELLDEYLRQLYLYCIPVIDIYKAPPEKLAFNCFKSSWVEEDFDVEKFEETKQWAKRMIERIIDNEDWSPRIDYFKCNYLCDVCDHCEYKNMMWGG